MAALPAERTVLPMTTIYADMEAPSDEGNDCGTAVRISDPMVKTAAVASAPGLLRVGTGVEA